MPEPPYAKPKPGLVSSLWGWMAGAAPGLLSACRSPRPRAPLHPKGSSGAPGPRPSALAVWLDHGHCLTRTLAGGGGHVPRWGSGSGISPCPPWRGCLSGQSALSPEEGTLVGQTEGRGPSRTCCGPRVSQDPPLPRPSRAPILSLGNSLPVPAGNRVIKVPLLTCQSCFWGADADGLGDPVGI